MRYSKKDLAVALLRRKLALKEWEEAERALEKAQKQEEAKAIAYGKADDRADHVRFYRFGS